MTAAGESKRIPCGGSRLRRIRPQSRPCVSRNGIGASWLGVFDTRSGAQPPPSRKNFRPSSSLRLEAMRGQRRRSQRRGADRRARRSGLPPDGAGIDVLVVKSPWPRILPKRDALLAAGARNMHAFCRSATSNASIPRCWRLSRFINRPLFSKCIAWECSRRAVSTWT